MKKTQTQGKCIFCQGLGLTKEHIWPNWFNGVLFRTDEFHNQLLVHYDFVEGSELSTTVLEKKRNGKLGSTKIRNVCAKCNNGWMSQIEDSVKEILTPMLLGHGVELNFNEQNIVALWIVMRTIMAEYSDLKTQAIPQSHREYIYNNRSIPPNWKIWIGKCEGEDWSFRYRHYSMGAYPQYDSLSHIYGTIKLTPNVQFSSMGLGHFFIHAITGPDDILKYSHFDDEVGLIQIWPHKFQFLLRRYQKIHWPPSKILSENLALNISDFLYNKFNGQKII